MDLPDFDKHALLTTPELRLHVVNTLMVKGNYRRVDAEFIVDLAFQAADKAARVWVECAELARTPMEVMQILSIASGLIEADFSERTKIMGETEQQMAAAIRAASKTQH